MDTFDYAGGGASRAAYRLHDGLRRLGVDSKMFVCYKLRNDPEVYAYAPDRTLPARLARRLRQHRWNRQLQRYAKSVPVEHSFYLDDRSVFLSHPFRQIPDADVIHLHWTTGFLDLGSFVRWLPDTKRVVWTIHDMAPLTGGCCYDLGCGKFADRCGACPQLGSRNESDPTRAAWQRKQRHYSLLDPARVQIVTPSRWMGTQVQRSPLLSRFHRSVIPNGLDLDVFQPRDRRVAREVFGIPLDARVVLFAAFNMNEFRKASHLMMDALDGMMADTDIFLLFVGRGGAADIQRFPHLHLDSIANDRILSFIYSAADVFVCPSLADNLPNTVMEAIACGTPVVAFAAGGIPELIRPEITGLLADTRDASDLRDAILQLLDNRAKRLEMSANCRRVAIEDYGVALQARRYQELYEDMLAGKSQTASRNELNAIQVENLS